MDKVKLVELKTALDEIETEKDAKIKSLEDKVEKLSAIPTKETPSARIEVGVPDIYKGYRFRRQAVDQPNLFPKDEKIKNQIIKEVIDMFAPHASKNSEIYKATMTVGNAGTGLEYVPEQWVMTVQEKVRDFSVALRDARIFPVSGNVIHIPKQGTSVTVTWANEGSASSQSEPGTADVDLTMKRVGLWGEITQELLDDAMNDIVSYITRDCVEALALEIDDQVWNGSQFTGLFSAITTNIVTMSGGIATITAAKIYEAIYKLKSIHRRNAKFYVPKEIMPYIQALTTGTSGTPLVNYLYNGLTQTLGGYPVVEVSSISGTDSTATGYITFGDLQNYAIGMRMMPQGIEINPYAGAEFKKFMVLFRMYARMAGAPIFQEMFSKIRST